MLRESFEKRIQERYYENTRWINLAQRRAAAEQAVREELERELERALYYREPLEGIEEAAALTLFNSIYR